MYAYSTDQFSWDKTTGTFSAFASDLAFPIGNWPFCITLRSTKTGNLRDFWRDGTTHTDGEDVQAVTYIPAAYGPQFKQKVKVLIFND